MHRKTLLLAAMVALLISAGPAAAYQWSIQLNGPQVNIFGPTGGELSELLADTPMVGCSMGLDIDLYKGLAVGFDFAGLYGYRRYTHDEQNLDERPFASAEIGLTQILIGVRYGYAVRRFWTPWAAVDLVPGVWTLSFYDEFSEVQNEGSSLGGRATLGSDFFPFYWTSRSHTQGIGFTLSLYYDYAPIDKLGVIDDGSGIGVALGFTYRFPAVGRKGDTAVWTESPPYQAPPEQPNQPDELVEPQPQPEDDEQD
ncbi:MAG: hypothetical protein P9M14_08310 [Candidatus Alcyoniella australis]|nr:hypothetical protein [Candidatus Alcyoniella australis]